MCANKNKERYNIFRILFLGVILTPARGLRRNSIRSNLSILIHPETSKFSTKLCFEENLLMQMKRCVRFFGHSSPLINFEYA